MSYYSFYDKKGKLVKEIFAYTRDTAFHIIDKMKDEINCKIRWVTYKRRKHPVSIKEQGK